MSEIASVVFKGHNLWYIPQPCPHWLLLCSHTGLAIAPQTLQAFFNRRLFAFYLNSVGMTFTSFRVLPSHHLSRRLLWPSVKTSRSYSSQSAPQLSLPFPLALFSPWAYHWICYGLWANCVFPSLDCKFCGEDCVYCLFCSLLDPWSVVGSTWLL